MDDVQKVGQIFDAFVDSTRRRVCLLLAEKGSQNVLELRAALGKISQPALSHHLQLLRLVGVVDFFRKERNNYYHLVEHDGFRLAIKLLEEIEAAPKLSKPAKSAKPRELSLYKRYLQFHKEMAQDDGLVFEPKIEGDFYRDWNSHLQEYQKKWRHYYEIGYQKAKQEMASQRPSRLARREP